MAESTSPASIILGLDNLFFALIKDAAPDQRTLAFDLYQAAVSVAVHGTDQVSNELAKRVTLWRAGRARRNKDETNRSRTARAVRKSKRPRNRAPADGGESAYEEVAREEGNIRTSTAEKRAYRKPKR